MLVEKKDKDKDTLTAKDNKKSRRSRRQVKEQETLLAYAVGSKATTRSGATQANTGDASEPATRQSCTPVGMRATAPGQNP